MLKAAGLVIIAIVIVLHLALCRDAALRNGGSDFGALRDGWLTGHMYAEPNYTGAPFRQLNPPLLFVIVSPLAALNIPLAFSVWTAIQILLAIVIAALGRPSLSAAMWLAAGVLTSATVFLGQLGAVLGVLVAGFWWFARTDRWRIAGVWLGAAIIFKPFLAPFFIWCALDHQRRRALAPALVSACILACVSVAIYGLEPHRAWIENLRLVTWYWGTTNASFHGWLARSFGPSPYFQQATTVNASTLQRIAMLGGGATLVMALWRAHIMDVDRATALLSLASLWASPLGWIYYGWIAVPPMLVLWREHRLNTRLVAIGAAALLMSPILIAVVHQAWWSLTFASSYFWGLSALLAAAFLARQSVATVAHLHPRS